MTSAQKFNCIFCKEIFDNKEALQVHFRKHGDPKFNQSNNKSRSQNEAPMSSEKSNEQIEMVGCDVCSEMFLTISKAITHKHKVHPNHDAKYFCPWCGKLFTMKHLYNKHLQASHTEVERNEDNNFHCNCCNVDFYAPSAMLYHNKFFHRQDTDLPAIGQSKKLKLYNQEVIPIYYCAFCGEEFDNKVNLHKHINEDHSDENQSPDEVLRCPLCDAIFYHLDAYELHLTFHSIEDLYSEKNEMINEITDFSLESVPPGVEKVESFEPQEEAETAINAVGIDKFLELAMDQTEDQGLCKVKKHKKHKKLKKSAITLDEFLNMNKDVFGEGLDFQGIEEVPTQVVAKRLKSNKKSAQPSKIVSANELQKLKRQGIVVKKKYGQNQGLLPDVNMVKEVPKKSDKTLQNTSMTKKAKPTTQTESNVLSTSSEVLSKLISQSNNQIKIFKKSNQENADLENQTTQQDSMNTSIENKILKSDKHGSAVKEIEGKKSNAEEINDVASKIIKNSKINENAKDSLQDSQNTSTSKSQSPSTVLDTEKYTKSFNNFNNPDDDEEKQCSNIQNDLNSNINDSTENNTVEFYLNNSSKRTNVVDSLNALRTKSDIIVKSAISNKMFPESCPNSNAPHINDVGDNHTQGNAEQTKNSSPKESLNALKHLSHLITIKSVNQITKSPLDNIEATENQSDERNLQGDEKMNEVNVDLSETKKEKALALNTLKNLSKNITVKTLSLSSTITSENIRGGEFDGDSDETYEFGDIMTKKGTPSRQNKPAANTVNSLIGQETGVQTVRHSPMMNKYAMETGLSNEIILNEKPTVKKSSSTILLKHLADVTAKPLSNMKCQQSTKSVQREEIEIFNIDDSDSDEIDKEQSSNKQSISIQTNKIAPHSTEALKSLSKHITVKSLDQKSTLINKHTSRELHSEENNKDANHSNHIDDLGIVGNNTKLPVNANLNSPKTSNKQTAINHALKNLSKNITIKSRNSSPSQSVKSQDQNTQDSNNKENDTDSDSNSCSSKVKITNIGNASDDDFPLEHTDETKARKIDENMRIQYSDNSNSHNDYHLREEVGRHVSDFESEIKVNTLKKSNPDKNPIVNSISLSNLNNISKDITIKSFNENIIDKEDQSQIPNLMSTDNKEISKNRNQLSITPVKQTNQDLRKDSLTSIDKYNKNVGHVTGRSFNQSAINQNSASSFNKVNMVNKEVTVKTFQTETNTVIEEITTTVTKTIKTVNQTMKQEVRNTSHVSSTPMVVPQKVQGMKSSQQFKKIQGIAVRHSSTIIGPKIRSIAPAIGTTVRPSNQIVPVRSGLNVARLSTPRMPNTKNIRPSTSVPQKPQVGKPVKVSPDAVMQSGVKRSIPEGATGHFSCFKKPKESLIPVSDVPVFNNDERESRLKFTSASQMSRSNFISSTKTVKGNSVVTSTQMKSEVSASSQQLSRLRNMSGLSIVKTSQGKQAQIEEKSEVSATKRTTLEAIQKLQKQGLLVKKPRYEDSEHSDSASDDNTGHSLNELNGP